MNCKFILRHLKNNSSTQKLIMTYKHSFISKSKEGYMLDFTNITPVTTRTRISNKTLTQTQNNQTNQTGISNFGNITIGNTTMNSLFSNSTKEIVKINNLNANDPTSTIQISQVKMFEVKLYIAHSFNIKPDNLNLYYSESKAINDFDSFPNNNLIVNKVEVNHQHKFNDTLRNWKITTYNLYYSIETKTVKVIINTMQKQVDQIVFHLAPFASIVCVKHYIIEKVSSFSAAKIEMLNWYGDCIYIMNSESVTSGDLNQYSVNKQKYNHWFDNHMTLWDILATYEVNIKTCLFDSNVANSVVISLLLNHIENNKIRFGLDFRFNFMKNLTKINYIDNAPSYREVSDGLNLFFYCRNEACVLYKTMYTKNFGYGQFDILKLSCITKCAKCDRLNSDLRNIGWINSRWVYKSMITGSTNSEGDGFTLDYKMYILPEIQFNKQFTSFLIMIERYVPEVHSDYSENNISDEYEEDEMSESNEHANVKKMTVKRNTNENKKSENNVTKKKKSGKGVSFRDFNITIDDIIKSQWSCCYKEDDGCFIY